MALILFDCANDTSYSVVSSSNTSIITKIDLYDNDIFTKINTYMLTINNCASSYTDSSDEDLKSKATFLVNKYNDFQTNIDYYKQYFRNKFNEMVSGTYNTDIDLLDKINHYQNDFLANFPEYYLMVKQTEKYTCYYKQAFDKLLTFMKTYGISGSIMCIFDNDVSTFCDDIDTLIDNINTTDISESMSYDDVQKQKLINAYNSYSTYESDLDSLNYNINNHGFDLKELYIAIGNFMFEVKLALKTIALGNIIMTASSSDLPNFNGVAQSMLSYQPDLPSNVKLEETPEMEYYNFKSMDIIQYGIPIYIEFRSYLKSDWSNFQQVLIPAVQEVLSTCSLYTYTGLILNYLPDTDDSTS